MLPALCLSAVLVLGGRQESPAAGDLAELVARDARAAFTADAAGRARVALESGVLEPDARAAAILALGCAGGPGDLARIESALADGQPAERRAALFALGERGAAGLPALDRALAAGAAGLEDALCTALAIAERRGAPAAGERIRALATAGKANPVLLEYFELRWRAARAYGLIDGRRGQKALLAELFDDEDFLDRVVLAAARVLPAEQLKAHLAESLIDGERVGALRVAAVQMPADLVGAIEGGSWEPSLGAWRAMLAEIELQRAARGSRGLVELAFHEVPELEARAGALLLSTGGSDLPWSWVAEHIEQGSPRERIALVEACGERGAREWTADFAALLERRRDLGLLGPGVVAAARLGHPPAQRALEATVAGPAGPERDQVVTALARVLHDRDLWPQAQEALRREDLPAEQRAALRVGLALGGATVERADLRAALAAATEPALRLRCVRALCEGSEQADLDALGALFPVEDDLDLNVELGLALLRARHPAITGLLRAALWKDGWNRSVLAGGLLYRVGGRRILIDEIASAPRTAREQDLRRVGFALGEWGGLAAVEELTRTRAENDPVLQGALLGALATRATEPTEPAIITTPTPRADRPADAPQKGKGPLRRRSRKGSG